MKYHNITKADMLNGEGLRVVLWVSGCSHHCQGCQNALTWNPDDGLLFDNNAKKEIFDELENNWCLGLTLSGGDPLYKDNRKEILELVREVKTLYPNKSIWCYTGYEYEDLDDDISKNILDYIDVLLDGKFILHLADEKIHYVGSSNQRVIDVKKTKAKNKIVLYKEEK